MSEPSERECDASPRSSEHVGNMLHAESFVHAGDTGEDLSRHRGGVFDEIDFAIATGWTNVILNPAVKRLLPPHRTEWAVIFVLLAALPHVGLVVATLLDR